MRAGEMGFGWTEALGWLGRLDKGGTFTLKNNPSDSETYAPFRHTPGDTPTRWRKARTKLTGERKPVIAATS